MKNKNIIKSTQKIDLNLFHLWLTLDDLKNNKFPDSISKEITKLSHKVDKLLFEKVPDGYDIVKEECYLTSYYEIPKFKKSN